MIEYKKNKKSKIWILIIIVITLALAYYITKKSDTNVFINEGGIEVAINNYKKDVDFYAKKNDLPSSYFMALIMLECSGKKNITPRYENHIYKKLKDFKNGKISKFENITQKEIKKYDDAELKVLAKSYGPFQIMGYKTIKMGVTVDDLQGEDAIRIGIEWINKEYGNLLRDGRFKDAFHTHNTGKLFPKSGIPTTYDPKYVENGLYYLKYFSKN
jgi:hypothetical protein